MYTPLSDAKPSVLRNFIVLSKCFQRLRFSELSSLVVNSGQLAPSDTKLIYAKLDPNRYASFITFHKV